MSKKNDGWVMIRQGGMIHRELSNLTGPRAKLKKFLADEFKKNGGRPLMCKAKTLKMVLEVEE